MEINRYHVFLVLDGFLFYNVIRFVNGLNKLEVLLIAQLLAQ